MCEMCYKRFKHDKYCPVCSLVYQDKDARDPSRMRSCANCRHAVPPPPTRPMSYWVQ
jgi:hypothetical protein